MEGTYLFGVTEGFEVHPRGHQRIIQGTERAVSPIRLPSGIDVSWQEYFVRLVHFYTPDAFPFLHYVRGHCDPTSQAPRLADSTDYDIRAYMKRVWNPSALTPLTLTRCLPGCCCIEGTIR